MQINELVQVAHHASYGAGWWHCPITHLSMIPQDNEKEMLGVGEAVVLNAWFPYVIGAKLALIHSEISEALEGYRKDEMDDKLPHRSAIECKLADAVIRIGDLAGVLGLDLEGAIIEKLRYNTTRPDHKMAARRQPNGKKF